MNVHSSPHRLKVTTVGGVTGFPVLIDTVPATLVPQKSPLRAARWRLCLLTSVTALSK